jgi:hypothetical protein
MEYVQIVSSKRLRELNADKQRHRIENYEAVCSKSNSEQVQHIRDHVCLPLEAIRSSKSNFVF